MKKRLRHTISIVIFFALASAVQAQTSDPVGRATLATQAAVAISITNTERAITRRSALYTGETIRTDLTGLAQLRMNDGAIILLGCNSSLHIERYTFEYAQNDAIVLNLQAGGLRTITGSISENDSTQYRLTTKNNWINTKNADFAVSTANDDIVYFAVFNGAITLSNNFGTLTLGTEGNANFARVEPGQPPSPLLILPQQLNSPSIATTSTQASANCP